MFLLYAEKNKLTLKERETVTAGSANVYDVQFTFSDDWDNMERIAVFQVGSTSVSVSLGDDNRCTLPWECMKRSDVGKIVYVGVYGQIGDEIILPTMWAGVCAIKNSTEPGEDALPKTPTLAEQLLAQIVAERKAAEQAASTAASNATDILSKTLTEVIADYLKNNQISGGSVAKIGTVELLAKNWATESEEKHYQVVAIDGVTPNSQVDLTPTEEQLVIWRDKELAFTTKNSGGVVTVYAIGQKPENDYTIQVTITEVIG